MSTVGTPVPAGEMEEPPKRSRKKILVIGVLVVVLAAAAAWWFMLRPAEADTAPEPGAVLKLEAIQVNLAENHYLRIGIALQATVDAGEELDGSKALDATIELFSGQRMEDLTRKAYRTKLKKRLLHQVSEAYEGEVMGVYFTDFVTQ